MAAGWYGGFRPGLLATVLCAIVAMVFFMENLEPPGGVDSFTWRTLRIGIFTLEGMITSALCDQLHREAQFRT